MAECKVTCYSGCLNDRGSGPKAWSYLCEDCAQEKQDAHRREGCADVHLSVSIPDLDNLRKQIRRASRMPLVNTGWW